MLRVLENPQTHINTTIFHSKPASTASSKSPLLIFIPGNPGFISYYTRYLSSLANNATSDLEILGISHAGFTSQYNVDKLYTLNEQIEHKIDIIRTHLGGDLTRRDVYIMGHSVGAWIVQRIVESTPEINYKFVGFITPTIVDIHKSKKGSLLWPITKVLGSSFYEGIGFLSKLAAYLPTCLIDSVLNFAVESKDFIEVKDITKHFILTPQFVRQSLSMAAEEMRIIQSDWQYQHFWFSKHDSVKKWVFLTSPDNWVSDDTQRDLIRFVSGYKNVEIDRNNNIKHSFCITQSDLFSTITLTAFNNHLDE